MTESNGNMLGGFVTNVSLAGYLPRKPKIITGAYMSSGLWVS